MVIAMMPLRIKALIYTFRHLIINMRDGRFNSKVFRKRRSSCRTHPKRINGIAKSIGNSGTTSTMASRIFLEFGGRGFATEDDEAEVFGLGLLVYVVADFLVDDGLGADF